MTKLSAVIRLLFVPHRSLVGEKKQESLSTTKGVTDGAPRRLRVSGVRCKKIYYSLNAITHIFTH